MTGMMSAMKKKRNGIPEEVLPIFEGIVEKAKDRYGNCFLE